MKPTPIQDVELWIDRGACVFAPNDIITGQYNLAKWLDHDLEAVELSLLWYTSGQGEEDFCVHFYDRFDKEGLPLPTNPIGRFAITLPASPPSYDGQIVKVCWTVRLRGFFQKGRQRVVEAPFTLLSDRNPNLLNSKEVGYDLT